MQWLKPFAEDRNPYAILSHTWREEQLHLEHLEICPVLAAALSRIRRDCGDALEPSQYLWVDACCIDQEDANSNVQAVESMISRYQCDTEYWSLPHDPELFIRRIAHLEKQATKLSEQDWWTRIWIAQELHSPDTILDPEQINSRNSLSGEDQAVLLRIRLREKGWVAALREAARPWAGPPDRTVLSNETVQYGEGPTLGRSNTSPSRLESDRYNVLVRQCPAITIPDSKRRRSPTRTAVPSTLACIFPVPVRTSANVTLRDRCAKRLETDAGVFRVAGNPRSRPSVPAAYLLTLQRIECSKKSSQQSAQVVRSIQHTLSEKALQQERLHEDILSEKAEFEHCMSAGEVPRSRLLVRHRHHRQWSRVGDRIARACVFLLIPVPLLSIQSYAVEQDITKSPSLLSLLQGRNQFHGWGLTVSQPTKTSSAYRY